MTEITQPKFYDAYKLKLAELEAEAERGDGSQEQLWNVWQLALIETLREFYGRSPTAAEYHIATGELQAYICTLLAEADEDASEILDFVNETLGDTSE